MSDSSLATVSILSPNCTKPRSGAIKGPGIHCAAGGRNATAKQILSLSRFTTYNRIGGASCHYAVGGDGSIGQGVREENRAWCTSDEIDHYLVTIEVATDVTPPYRATDKAVEALIRLLADICKRNGIPKLLWKGDKSLMGQWEKQNMVVHRWTAAKACPGDYLYQKHGEIAERVNAILAQGADKKEDDDMNEDAVKKLMKPMEEKVERMTGQLEEIEKMLEAEEFNSVSDVEADMDWAAPTIQKLVDKGLLKGDQRGELGLTYDQIRLLVILDRAGAFDHV